MRSPSLAILAIAATTNVAAADPHDVEGLWLTQARDGHIEIKDCGDGSPCGTLVWVDPATTERRLMRATPMKH